MTDPSTTGGPEPSTPVDWLAVRAQVKPHMPWLFFREGWHWAWRSWRRVADQVARGLETLNHAGISAGDHLAFQARQDPDSVAVGLTIQAAGGVAVPIRSAGASLEPPPGDCIAWIATETDETPQVKSDSLPNILLPAALSAVERTERRTLRLDPSSARGRVASPHSADTSAEALLKAAHSLEGRLQKLGQRSRSGKIIACFAPTLDHAIEQVLQTWSLTYGAAWVLEPHPDAFLPALLWARPTIAAVSGAELEPLVSALAVRKHRRHSRLTELVTVGDTARDLSQMDLGLDVVALGENPLESLIDDNGSQ